MNTNNKLLQYLILFTMVFLAFLLLNRLEFTKEPVPTPTTTFTFISTSTLVPTETFVPTAAPTATYPPPVIVEQQPILVIPDERNFDNSFYTAMVCANVPVFSQPASNYHLIIGKLYKGNLIDVTGRSMFWARISYSGQVGYVPIQYVEC